MTQKTKATGILFSILTGIAAIGFFLLMFNQFPTFTVGIGIMCAIWVVIAIEALIYFSRGGRKEDSRFFKAFTWTFLLSIAFREVFVICNPFQATNEAVQVTKIAEAASFILWLITYSCYLLLAFSENLGGRKSANLTLIAIVNTFIITLVELILLKFTFSCIIEGLITVFGIIVYYEIFKAKYEDKDARGTV